ncbi:hypothetical protein SLEP1_g39189 [Rubroshorea leprosula]|uniref:Transmembrane protein n=1 Tax=Rubroshorea leprosula TaxID=152421 RepID=A0AAV5L0K1_9ROSI|nr:hypothetical protein SLEP1_g39189 [Rubroshorea leprosula]
MAHFNISILVVVLLLMSYVPSFEARKALSNEIKIASDYKVLTPPFSPNQNGVAIDERDANMESSTSDRLLLSTPSPGVGNK